MQNKQEDEKYLHTAYDIDRYCRDCLKCDLREAIQLNRTKIASHLFVQNCECERNNQHFIRNIVGGSTGGFIPFAFSLCSKQCYSLDYPIVKCKKYQYFFEPKKQSDVFPNHVDTESIRCLEYALDKSKPKIYQIFDLPFDFELIFKYRPEYIEEIEQIGLETVIRSALLGL